MKMIKQPTIPPMPKQPIFDARDTQYNLPIGTDCISRQQAINAIDECYCGGEDSCGEPWIYKENAVEAIQMIEPILPAEPKRGKWIKSGRWGRVYKCNQCGNFLDFDGVNAGRGDANFCPNCGADMRGEQDDSV